MTASQDRRSGQLRPKAASSAKITSDLGAEAPSVKSSAAETSVQKASTAAFRLSRYRRSQQGRNPEGPVVFYLTLMKI